MSYSQLVLHIAKVMELAVDQLLPEESDKVYEDINHNPVAPLHVGFIPSLLKHIKESWGKPSSAPQQRTFIRHVVQVPSSWPSILHPIVWWWMSLSLEAVANHCPPRQAKKEGNWTCGDAGLIPLPHLC